VRKGFLQWRAALLSNLQHARTLRFAVGVTVATALAYGIEWPLSFLLPVLSVVVLALPTPMPSLQKGITNMLETLLAFMIGVLFTLVILPHPLFYVVLLGLALFKIYYHLNRGGSFWLVLMTLVSILLMPMLLQLHQGLGIGVALGFIWSGWLTIFLVWFVHWLVPDPEGVSQMPAGPGFQNIYSPPAAETAIKSTIVALPIAILFIANSWAGQMVVMLFVAIFTLSPDLDKSKTAGLNSIKSTLIGGFAAFFFYWLLVVVPEYHFFVFLTFFTSLLFGAVINSGKPIARYFNSAMVALLILVNGSLGEDADFSSNFFSRIVFISMAVMYVVVALRVLSAYWPLKGKANKPVAE